MAIKDVTESRFKLGRTARRSASPEGGMYVQFGCGFCAPEGWRSFDSSYTLLYERLPIVGRLFTKNSSRFPPSVQYGNVVKGLPVAPNSCRGIYASHVLEHLAFEDCRIALANTYRALRPDGIFRLIVPDLELDARRYLQALATESPSAGEAFMESMALGRRRQPSGIIPLLYSFLNSSAHLWMWDFPSMRHQLEEAGFVRVRRCSYHDSDDPGFLLVEDALRFEGALAIEARKPAKPTTGQ